MRAWIGVHRSSPPPSSLLYGPEAYPRFPGLHEPRLLGAVASGTSVCDEMRMLMRHHDMWYKAWKSRGLPEKVPGSLSRPSYTGCWIWTRRIPLPRTRVNKAGVVLSLRLLTLRLLTLANRVVERRYRYTNSEGA